MGMSASQSRYVLLTGRQSDVEYQGQQINQQRTTLATETASYNTQLLNLTVPVPPSTDQFSKTTYTFQSNGQTYTITGTQYRANAYIVGGTTYPGGTYLVYLNTNATISQGKSSGSSIFSSAPGGQPPYMTSQGTILQQVITDPNDPNYDPVHGPVDASNTTLITQDTGAAGPFYKYTSNGVTKYVSAADLAANANTTNAIPTYYVDENATNKENSQLGGCQVTWNESGRMTSITDANGHVYSLNVTATNDQDAYNDAYNEYEYKKAEYQKDIENINSKICIIQSEDKKLELKLKDLDTQQQAIQTEIDAVKKVIDKNIESSFKTFA